MTKQRRARASPCCGDCGDGSGGGSWEGGSRGAGESGLRAGHDPGSGSCNQTFPGSEGAPAPPVTPSASAALMKIRHRSLELLSISVHSILGITKSPS